MIHQAIEGQVTWLPGVSHNDIPYPWPSSISIRVRSTGLGVVPQGVVGTVPLLNGDTIQILPKIGRVSFFRLFVTAGGLQQELKREFDEFVLYSLDDESDIDSLVARHLYLAALDILRLGSQIGRVHRRREGSFAMGRIDARATAFNIAAHRREPVAFWSRERTYDIPENRILTEAITQALPLLAKPDRDAFAHVYRRWLSRFTRSRNLIADLGGLYAKLDNGRRAYGVAASRSRRGRCLLGSGGATAAKIARATCSGVAWAIRSSIDSVASGGGACSGIIPSLCSSRLASVTPPRFVPLVDPPAATRRELPPSLAPSNLISN